jgi:hypothetical protein
MLPLDDDILRDGFCWGLCEITVDRGPRIRLPKAVIKIMKQHKV